MKTNNLQDLYANHIQQLVECSYNILITIENNSEYFYLVRTFDPPVESASSPINFLKIHGICINDFFYTKCNESQMTTTIKLFEKWIENKENYTYTLSTNYQWKLIKLGK